MNGINLEKQIEGILKKLKGVDDVSVLITYEETNKVIPMYNEDSQESVTKEEDVQGGTRVINESSSKKEIIYEESNGQKSVVTSKVITPEIKATATYECERSGSIVIPNCQSAGTSYATKEKIGLIYASDFMYASGYLDSESVDYGYNNNLFVNQNWLYNYEMWTITHSTELKVYDEIIMDECVWHIDYGGLNISTANESKNVYPVLYLTSSVYIATGDGTFDNPYTLYM